jgi:hypothetical protein
MALCTRRHQLWVSAVCAVAISAGAAPSRRAVLVGINDYSASHLSHGDRRESAPGRVWPQLHGAVNDVLMMRELLVHLYKFKAADIVLLQDQEATRSSILDAIEKQLVAPSASDDVALFYFSGHGSQVLNLFSDETDKLDESIIPADSRAGALDIRDKELRRELNHVLDKGARLTVILDSCHSGSGTRVPSGAVIRHVGADLRDVADRAPFGPPLERRGAVVLSAAQDFETARETYDDHEQPVGAFSWAWMRALHDAEPDESVNDTFLRAQARMRLECPSQNPVLSAEGAARLRPFLGIQRDHQSQRPVVAIAQAGKSVISLEGGWANGLSAGTLLRPVGGGTCRVEVTRLLGLTRSEARAIEPAGVWDCPLHSGSLLEVVSWTLPSGRNLRIWMPRTHMEEAAQVGWLKELERTAASRGLLWIVDPVEQPADYVLRLLDTRCELWKDGNILEQSPVEEATSLLRHVPKGACLFVQLPPVPYLTAQIHLGPETSRSGIEEVDRPDHADYLLTGRWAYGRIEYAWVRPDTRGDAAHAPLPSRSKWYRLADLEDTVASLTEVIVALRKIYAWSVLTSPPSQASPYGLIVKRGRDGTTVTDGILVDGREYGIALRRRASTSNQNAGGRYNYVFVIDSSGHSSLLFGRSSVENRLPLPDGGSAVEIPLGASPSFTASAPFGTDTFFLLTTDEPLPSPALLEWDGIRGRSAPATELERLFALLQSGRRSAAVLRTPAAWSIERTTFQTTPADKP